jgi:DNA-damage-inducible protein J
MKAFQQASVSQTDNKTMATINVRIDKGLKTGGDEILKREGVSVSDAIRRLYSYLETEQSIPEFLRALDESCLGEVIAKKRASLKNLIGVSVSEISLDEVKDTRLERQLKPGVQ